jgi:hypothetical protein
MQKQKQSELIGLALELAYMEQRMLFGKEMPDAFM